MLLNFSPLIKYRDFRLLFLGQLISFFGTMLTYVALPYQIYHLTHSALAVGNVGLIQLVPLLITSLWGGALADKFDRKKLLLGAELGAALAGGLLLLNTVLTHPQVWLIYCAAAISSAFFGIHRPTLQAVVPLLVEKKDIPLISPLTGMQYAIGTIAAPALAGFIIAKFGLVEIYFADVCTYFFALLTIYNIKKPMQLEHKQSERILKSIASGLRYAASRQELIGTYVVDIVAMIFGMPMALFPAIAQTMGGVKALGWLYAAPSLGLLVISLFSGWTHKIQRHGVAIAVAASVWGLAIVIFGFMKDIYLAVFFLAVAGAADQISGIFRTTVWNQAIPDQMRGRLASIAMISYMSGPLLGNAEAGFVAALTNVTFSVVSGGVLCVIGVAISVLFLPRFWCYDAEK